MNQCSATQCHPKLAFQYHFEVEEILVWPETWDDLSLFLHLTNRHHGQRISYLHDLAHHVHLYGVHQDLRLPILDPQLRSVMTGILTIKYESIIHKI